MRLNFDDFKYDDYSDIENWRPRFNELQDIAAELVQKDLSKLTDTELLDRLEDVEELMRYYTATSDYKNLEGIMRLQQTLLLQGKTRGLSSIPYTYFCLMFERINAMLFYKEGQNKKAAECYETACKIASECADRLKADYSLNDKQKLYVGWACQSVLNESVQAYDSVMNYAKMLDSCNRSLELIQWLESYMVYSSGIYEKTADIYCSYGSIFFQSGYADKGRFCFQNSIRMFDTLYGKLDDVFWNVRSLWVEANYGIQQYISSGDTSILRNCEEKCKYALNNLLTNRRDIAIANSAIALILLQQGTILQNQGKIDQAIEKTKQGIDLYNHAIESLKEHTNKSGASYRLAMNSIISKISASYIGAHDTLGVLQYNANQYDEAKKTFQKLLELLQKSSDTSLMESVGIALQAEGMYFMALLALEENDSEETIFYAEQAVALTSGLAETTSNSSILRIKSFSCFLLAEYYLEDKNKPKALTFAENAIQACEKWQKIEPQLHGQTELMDQLNKIRKKASRGKMKL